MIDSLRQYLLSVVAAAIICGIINALISKNSLSGSIVKLLSGIFMTICVVSPIVKLDFSSINGYEDFIKYGADESVETGTYITEVSIRQSIKQQTETYILDKAASMNAELTVEVTLSDDELPVPKDVTLTGHVSPYIKTRLSQLIVNDLGIPKENQTWN